MADYEGMRWFKCDLQMQTPADAPHWRGAQMGTSVDEQMEAARAYIRRCYEVGLEAIAITDHNYLSKSFIPYLQEFIHELTGEFGYRMVLFPGFEFEADVGKGVHILGIFEPDANLEELDHLLTECGVGFPRIQGGVLAKSTRRLPELLKCIQQVGSDGKQRGIVVMPHALKDDGLFDNGKVSDWLQQTEYLNPDLLAVEVPKPVHEMSPGWRRLFGAGADCDPAWKRQSPMACIMSSDNKALTKEEDAENYIGMRYTWVKMSKPSVEALRQAFLDHESRIRLQPGRPSDDERHPRLVSISVKGAAFVEDQIVHFSPNLNCVIGGRGSGKSSLLEYARFAVNLDEPAARGDEDDPSLQRKRRQLKESLTAGSELRVSFEVGNGVSDTLVYAPGKPAGQQRWLDGRDVADLNTVLRQLQVQFFSQGELSRMTNGAQGQAQVLSLIDTAGGAPLLELKVSERELKARLKTLFQSTRDAARLRAEVAEAQQEAVELERQLKAREAVQEDSQLNQLALEARRHLGRMKSADAPMLESVGAVLKSLGTPLEALAANAERWPKADWFKSTVTRIEQGRAELASAIDKAVEEYQHVMAACVGDDATREAEDAIAAVQGRFRAACVASGIQEDDIARMQDLEEKLQEKLKLVDDRQKRLADVQSEADKFPQVLEELHDVWQAQFDARRATAQAIEEAVASRTVRLSTSFMSDESSFRAAWGRLAPADKRGKLARRWDDIGEELFQTWAKRADASVWETLEIARADAMLLGIPLLEGLHQPLFVHLDSDNVRALWEDVRISRVSDGIDVELLREDRTVAGSMSGALSEGQRNTVLLNLMLARGEGPIVIDQPEDELDSSFIYRTLVRDLRAAKSKRQLIVATHNANLAVNADAEQIYALEARDGRGKLRAQGGLDRKGVAEAVLDIMEGSEQAFKQRSEKYHF